MAPGSNTRYFLDAFCTKEHVNLIPEMELASYSLVTEFIKEELGIGLVTKEFLIKELEKVNIFEIKTMPKLPNRHIGAIFLKNQALSCCSKEFLQLIKKNITNKSYIFKTIHYK